ncbi:hypothetical protein HN51_13285 [Ectopseudomonas mendocina]|uniref:Uncharacterized protein n=1 Tax=Ectopseudomonas mendocina S5.2 TaxID=1225174 RepID=A0ABM5VU57_ECTME|nr:hypothetical protein DW68_006965 [Pseudomonas mendocina S5.2]KES00783.1 hypothetical protein HN51_13285 [Pseudomonas mendocina]
MPQNNVRSNSWWDVSVQTARDGSRCSRHLHASSDQRLAAEYGAVLLLGIVVHGAGVTMALWVGNEEGTVTGLGLLNFLAAPLLLLLL